MDPINKLIEIKPNTIRPFHADGSFFIKFVNGAVTIIPDTNCFSDDKYEPTFKHDCDKCIFLFNISDCYLRTITEYETAKKENRPPNRVILDKAWDSLPDDNEYDMYYCNKNIPTIIARYGNEVSEYISGFELDHPAINAAKEFIHKVNMI